MLDALVAGQDQPFHQVFQEKPVEQTLRSPGGSS